MSFYTYFSWTQHHSRQFFEHWATKHPSEQVRRLHVNLFCYTTITWMCMHSDPIMLDLYVPWSLGSSRSDRQRTGCVHPQADRHLPYLLTHPHYKPCNSHVHNINIYKANLQGSGNESWAPCCGYGSTNASLEHLVRNRLPLGGEINLSKWIELYAIYATRNM